MIRFIRNLFVKGRSASIPTHITYEPPDLGFVDMQNNFAKRTFGFESYKKRLGRDDMRLLNWIGSVDYCGHIREECLRWLIANYQTGDENRILLRLEDWVPQIRKIAEQWVAANFNKLAIRQIDVNHRLVIYLSRKERLRDSEAIRVINQCLLQKAEQLSDKTFYALNSNLRRYLYLLGSCSNSILRRLALFDKDPFNRLLLIRLFPYDELTEHERDVLRRDKSTLVKRRFMSCGLANNIVPRQDELAVLAMDRSRGIRELARYCLSKYYNANAYDLYKQRRDDAFYYISDYSKEADIEYFVEGTNSDNKRVRCMCLKAICNIDPGRLRRLDLRRLMSENRRVRILLSRNLPLIASLDELKEYRDTLSQTTANGILIYLDMILRKSVWHFVDLSLSLLVDEMSEKNLNHVSQRFCSKTQIYEALPPALRASISAKVSTLRDVNKRKLQELLRQISFAVEHA